MASKAILDLLYSIGASNPNVEKSYGSFKLQIFISRRERKLKSRNSYSDIENFEFERSRKIHVAPDFSICELLSTDVFTLYNLQAIQFSKDWIYPVVRENDPWQYIEWIPF
ncbi:hypothetical protein CDAR_375841 [Caerostris darwini]|uniref:Uncharacterized protein n=1 Tax=Caerostris darwini TaxID=1538125 RepID=A0AAV4S8J8_9ARAC|nr:hypothetical protein CDAR_375841 [Caerostris darwini]